MSSQPVSRETASSSLTDVDADVQLHEIADPTDDVRLDAAWRLLVGA